jgi:hypothetical protein
MRTHQPPTLLTGLLLATAIPAQASLVLGTTPNASTPIGGALTLELSVGAPVTLTQMNFWVGAGTSAGAAVAIDVYLHPSSIFNTSQPGWAVRIARTAPQTTTVAGVQQIVGATLVPAAPFPSLTLPSGVFGLSLVADNCSLGATIGSLSATSPQFAAHGGTAYNGPPWTSTSAGNQRTFTGTIGFALGGTPINFQENVSYGTACGGLALTAAGTPTFGGVMTFTTSNQPIIGIGLLLIDIIPASWPGGLALGLIGAPGCTAYVPPSGLLQPLDNVSGGLGSTFTLSLPQLSLFTAQPLFAQSVWFDPAQNLFGIAASNAVRIRIG